MDEPNATLGQPGCASPIDRKMIPLSRLGGNLASILDRYMADLQAGIAPNREQLLAAHPDLAVQLEGCLAGIEFIHQAVGAAAEKPATLGEFRIIREIGRGGMGVVYEAEQTSLRRHVALKVLRFGVVDDEEAMQRFRREAETVARLHHTNIVPIFAIGCEGGVHYYAMQFIEGRSLADVLAESQGTRKPLLHEEVARWGLQAAEALAHAHQRGVIHRDIKPSNLLLDSEGVVWLTDFGLAKRADEVTLTVRGALMGTPRYMSPEQAESLERPIDHRTDVYSLGASLYELATGRPVFESATSHGVISQILNEEPARPSQIRPGLPRDFETIILTCLAKEPAQRFQSARAVAEDLRAVLDGRPIRARRARISERVVRYVRTRKKVIGSGAVGVAATVLVMVGALLGWRFYSDWQLGRIVLTNDGPPLTAQVLPDSGDQPAGEPFEVVTRSVLALPAGDYRLRLNGVGRLGRTYRFAVNRGETQVHALSLDEGRLLGGEPPPPMGGQEKPKEAQMPFARVTVALELTPGKADLVEWTGQTLIRRDGLSGKTVWDVLRPAKPFANNRDPAAWLRKLSGGSPPDMIVEPAPDLDGDGIGDLVWVLRDMATILALSGKDGSVLWNYAPELDGPGGPQAENASLPGPDKPATRPIRSLGAPALADLDRDGIPDLIAMMQFSETSQESARRAPAPAGGGTGGYRPNFFRRVMVAVAGRSGRWLWSYPVNKTFVSPSHNAWKQLASVVQVRGSAMVAIVDGWQWVGLDPATGRPRTGPIDLGDVPVRQVQYADLDGDGEPEVLALGPGAAAKQQTLAAFSITSGRELWVETVNAPYGIPYDITVSPDWPLIVDLDGDGRPEIVVPDSGPVAPRGGYRGLRVLDGRSGRTRWARPMRPETKAEDGLEHVMDAPDLDHDGVRELVTVSVFIGRDPSTSSQGGPSEPERIYVDAFSGKDGRPLWWWHVDIATDRYTHVWPPRWWGRGRDGWPLLAVALGGQHPQLALNSSSLGPPMVHLLEASTGREAHTIAGLTAARTADLDGDGLADLWGEADGQLRAFRGEAPEVWRALGRFSPADAYRWVARETVPPAVDLDGDGIADTLNSGLRAPGFSAGEPNGSRTAVARSGRDGHVLWKTVLDSRESWNSEDRGESYSLTAFPLPAGDLDGDGTPDVVVQENQLERPGQVTRRAATLPLRLLSGRTGGRLWTAGPLPLGYEAHGYSAIHWDEVRVMEPHGAPDVLVRHGSPFAQPGPIPLPPGSHRKPHLARLSGRDGRILWDIPLADYPEQEWLSYIPPPCFDDLDGDRALDTVQLIPPSPRAGQPDWELTAVSLREGKRLWTQPLKTIFNSAPYIFAGDLDGDKRPEVVAMVEGQEGDRLVVLVKALDGRDGRVRWTWNSGAEFPNNRPWPMMVVADLDGAGKRKVCVSFMELSGMRRIVVLDAQGRESARRDVSRDYNSTLGAADLDGDGRDELLVWYGDRLRAWERDLKERWSWPDKSARIEQIIPASSRQPATLVLNPAVGLDGVTGHPRWAGQPGLTNWGGQFQPGFLDRGHSTGLPLLVSYGHGATICRAALRTASSGAYEPPRGDRVQHGLARDDPRWTRPLPWTTGVASSFGPMGFVTIFGLTLVNVVVPLVILRLAARRRFWSVRLLMALPVAAAVPLSVFLAVEPVMPALPDPFPSSARLLLILGTLAGIPVVAYVIMAALTLLRRRWRRLALLAAPTVLAAAALGVIWLWWDMQSMPAIEHYTWSGWYQVVLPAAFAVGMLGSIFWAARGIFRLVTRVGRRHGAATPLAS